MIGCPTIRLRKGKVLVHKPRRQLVESIDCLKGQTIVLVVVKVGTRFGIDLM